DNERAAQDLSAVANNVLRETDRAYWELVRSLKQLQIAIQQRELLEQQASRAGNQFRAGRITTYDKAQVDANLEVTRNLEEIAWNNLALNSNVLVDLLDYESGQTIVPVAYSELLGELFEFDAEEAFETARSRNPEFKASELALQSSDILLTHRKQQTRPDLRLVATLGLVQTDRVLGYESFGDSVSNLFDPDQNDFFVGISYRYPFGNKALKSALTQARLSRDQAQAQLQLTENAIVQDINSITATAYSAQARVGQTRAGVDLSQLAYDKARDRAGSQGVTEFELLSRLNSLLGARSAYIDALVDYRQSQAQLLAAQGVLAERY
ncbi:MAG: TolC family protein, partial [Gammaproteobacteria bacterium]